MSMTSTKWILTLAAAMFLAPAGPALAQSLSLQQCANGTASAPRACTGSAWITGTVSKKNSHYAEGDSAPFRLVFQGLTVGTTDNVITFQWDTTEAGVHAYDYLKAVDATETLGMGLNPCSGVAGCALGSFTTIAIPADPNVTAAGVTPDPGFFTMFGATPTSVSYGSAVGTRNGRSSATISVTFTAFTSNPVLAWSGHLASPLDWGAGLGASNVSGTLQMRLYSFNGKNKSQTQSLSGVAPLP